MSMIKMLHIIHKHVPGDKEPTGAHVHLVPKGVLWLVWRSHLTHLPSHQISIQGLKPEA